jgi:glycosyltransferase involved in cell wall biosynthesis
MFSSVWTARRAGPVDVVMGTSPPIFQAFSALAVAMIRRAPFLLEVRDLWPAFAVDMGVLKAPLLIKASEFLERFLYRRATHILVNSPAYREHVIASGIAANKVSFISNGVDTEMFDAKATGARLRAEWQVSNSFVVTYAGALGAANVLVGDGKERPRLERAAAEMRLPNVLFAGTKSKAEMPEVLAASNACLAILQNIRMFKTTYPNKVFDYMAAGRPTILAIDGVIRSVIEKSGGGLFVPPGDDAALAAAVETLSEDHTKAREMGRAARAYVVQHFNRRDQAQQFAELLERMAC